MNEEKSLWPTHKWMVGTLVQIAGWLIGWSRLDWHMNTTLQVAGIVAVVHIASTYLMPNLDTPGGVPLQANDPPGRHESHNVG